MNLLSALLPWMLLVRNTVDFRDNGPYDGYVNALNYTVTQYVDTIEENNHIRFINKTGSLDENGISYLGLQFESPEHVMIDDARRLMLALIDSFLDAINSCPRLRPYLHPYPFTPANIEIRVSFTDNRKYPYPSPGEIKYVSFIDGSIIYNTGNPRFIGQLDKFREETLLFARTAASRPGSPPLFLDNNCPKRQLYK